jgi:hypothetical protein
MNQTKMKQKLLLLTFALFTTIGGVILVAVSETSASNGLEIQRLQAVFVA